VPHLPAPIVNMLGEDKTTQWCAERTKKVKGAMICIDASSVRI